MPETNESSRIKIAVLRKIGKGVSPTKAPGPSNYYIEGKRVHARFCSTNDASPRMFKFNINPNTLQADFELWICGEENHYYLIPTTVMRRIHNDPNTYVDNRHPNIRVVSVDASTDKIIYKTGGGRMDVAEYRNKSI